MALAGSLEIALTADVARLRTDLGQVKTLVGGTAKDMEMAFGKVGESVGKVTSALGALGISLGAGALAALARHAIDAADHLNDLTKSTGLAVEELAGLNIAAKQSGTSLDNVAAAISKMNQTMGKSADMFKVLGITAKDPLEAFKQVADMFAALGTEQEKAALGAMVFGKSWAQIAPLLAEGGKKIGEMTEQGARLSKMTKEIAEQSDAFNDKLVILTGTGAGMNMVLNAMLPLLNTLADDMVALSQSTKATSDNFNPLLEAGKAVVIVFGNVAFVLKGIGTDLGAMAAQLGALARGDLKAFMFIGQEITKDAAKARVEFDRWEDSIHRVGTAAQVAAGKLDAMDQISRRMASAAAAEARREAEEAGKRLKAAQDLEENKRNAAAAEKARLAEEKRLRDLDLKGWIDYANNWEKSDFEATNAIAQGHIKLNEENQKLLDKGTQDTIEAYVNNTAAAAEQDKIITDHKREQNKQQIADAEEAARKQAEAYAKVWQQVDDFAFSAFESMFKKGEDTWKHLAESLKHTIIRALYELTVQKWTLQLFASVMGGPTGQAAAGAAGGGMGGYANLAGSALGAAGGSAAALSAYTGAVGSGATAAGLGAGAAAEMGAAAAGTVAGAEALAAVAAVVPVIGWVVAAAALVYALVQASKEPAQVRGGLSFAGPFEDQTPGTKTPFGTIGFSDAMTQQFSGQVGKAFTDAIGALLTAGAAQLTPEAVDDVTKQMHDTILLSAEGTFTTEEFLTRFGPDMARQLLDPMLAAVDPYAQKLVDSFEGPLQELLNLAADVLAVTGALSARGEEFTAIFGQAIDLQALEAMRGEGESFTATLNRLAVEFQATNAIALLMGKTQEETWGAIGLASEEARAQLIQFAGGVDALNASLGSYYEHYFTAEEKQRMQQQALADSFAKLGVTMPTTLAAFRKLVEAQDLTTEAGRQQYAGLLKLETQLYNFITATDKAETAVSDLAVAVERLPVAVERFGVAQSPTGIPFGTPGTPGLPRPEEVVALAAALKTEAELRERLLQLGMTSNEVLERNRELQLMKLELEEREAQMLPGTLTNLQKQINAQEDLNKAADEAAKAIGNIATATAGIGVENSVGGVYLAGQGLPGQVWISSGGNFGYWAYPPGYVMPGSGASEEQRLALLAQIYDLLGDKVNALVVLEIQRALALQQLAPELRGLQQELWILQDAAAAAAKALEFMNAKRALEIQLARAQGNEALAVEMEHAAIIEELNRQWGAGSQQATELIALYQQLWSITGDVAVATDGWIKSLQDWLRSITLDETLSPLTARQRFDYAQQQYVETLMGAQGGDADARARFTETADAYLRESLSMFGRASFDYRAIYDAIVAQTEGLIAQGLGPAAPVTMGDLNSTLLAGQATAREQMTTLLAKVDTLVEATTDGSDTVARSVQNIPLPTAPLA